jgi:hypothetical protein
MIAMIGHGSARLRIDVPYELLGRSTAVLRYAWMVSRADLRPVLGVLPCSNQCVCNTLGFTSGPR